MDLDRQRIEDLISAVADRLEGDWLLIGGALVALWLLPRRVTEDIDLIGIGDAAAQRGKLFALAWDLGLPVETLNSAADFFVARLDGWREQIEPFRRGAKGTVFRPSPELFLRLKLSRLSEQDLEDCLATLDLVRSESRPLDRERLLKALDELAPTGDAELERRRRELRAELER
ncbi:MAG: hypothetical protein ACYCWW_17435 [Deltaproteobacteria bacterium]